MEDVQILWFLLCFHISWRRSLCSLLLLFLGPLVVAAAVPCLGCGAFDSAVQRPSGGLERLFLCVDVLEGTAAEQMVVGLRGVSYRQLGYPLGGTVNFFL